MGALFTIFVFFEGILFFFRCLVDLSPFETMYKYNFTLMNSLEMLLSKLVFFVQFNLFLTIIFDSIKSFN